MRHRAYTTAFRVEARQQTRYRGAAMGGIVTQVFFGLILVALYDTLSGGTDEGFRRTATYVWLQQIFFRAYFNLDSELNDQVMTGNVAYSMLRPVDLHSWWFWRAMAQKIITIAMRILPMLLLQLLLPERWRMLPPAGVTAFLQFSVSLLIGFMIICQINLICSAISMRTLDNKGITAMINLLMMILAGNIIPLTLVPDRLQTLIRLQPFAQLLDAPIRMYQGMASAGEWLAAAALQLGWLVLLWGLCRWMWSRNLLRIEVQGG
ncbi:MAG: ABC-2 family transporter protein [Clostridia bacterium]|nr:ABC-2 family transporter protein [Clostridia bacterium]